VDKQSVIHPTTSQPPTLPTHRHCRSRVENGEAFSTRHFQPTRYLLGSFPSCFWHLFRPAGRVPFGSRPKRNQKGLPRHPALRFAPGSFAPSPFQGHAAKGHPWPIAALAASMPLNPFHGDSAHPPERGGWCCRSVQKKQIKPKSSRATRSPFPPVAEWRCCVAA